jgi:hypothetical protein
MPIRILVQPVHHGIEKMVNNGKGSESQTRRFLRCLGAFFAPFAFKMSAVSAIVRRLAAFGQAHQLQARWVLDDSALLELFDSSRAAAFRIEVEPAAKGTGTDCVETDVPSGA